jgi:hypothetical protein
VVVGTPVYMAPEQAAGCSQEIGPGTDVYALGVILYEMLTGRVPFRASSVAETLNQVLTQPPVPPGRLQPGVPARLEAICLKCLEKAVVDRHGSAAALAEDLQRFLDNEPVQAPRRPDRTRRPPRPRAVPGEAAEVQAPRRVGRTRRVWWAAAAVALVVAAGLLYPLWPGTGTPSPPPGPLDAEVTVRVYGDGEPGKPWLKLDQEGALPVHPGELVRIEVALNQAAHAYLLLLTSEGQAVPLYPWNADTLKVKDVAAMPPAGAAQKEVASPVTAGRGWKFNKHPGLETVLVLARREPWPEGVKLAALLGEVPRGRQARLRDPREAAILRLDRGDAAVSALLWQERGVEDESQAVDDPLLRIMGRLRQQFEVVRAVRFAHVGP